MELLDVGVPPHSCVDYAILLQLIQSHERSYLPSLDLRSASAQLMQGAASKEDLDN